jgi:hypothetical protein
MSFQARQMYAPAKSAFPPSLAVRAGIPPATFLEGIYAGFTILIDRLQWTSSATLRTFLYTMLLAIIIITTEVPNRYKP